MRVPLVIGGEEITEASGGETEIVDPATGETIGTTTLAGPSEVAEAAEAAAANFASGAWSAMRPVDRGRVMLRVAERLLDNREELARLEVAESGKPLRDAYWEVDCSARFFEYYGGYCDKNQGTSVPLGRGWMDWTVKEPVGVSLHIVPWNYPLQVAVRGVAPALAVGCTVIVKPSTETPASVWRLAQLAIEAGLPAGTLNVIPGSGSIVGDVLARHPAIDQITFTGSVETGRRVMEAAASHTIPVTMELGGKSPQILFDDADLARALAIISQGMFGHAGQVCNAGTRLIVAEPIQKEAVEALHARTSAMTLGHGMDDPDMGPVISLEAKHAIEAYIEVGRSEGAEVLVGADVPDNPRLRGGAFVRPTVLANTSNAARVAREEIFGPVLSVIPFGDDDEGVRLANQSDFGLVAGVFTSNLDRAMRAAEQLRVGQVWINSFGIGLDVEFPFGGYKRSGFGREKGLEALSAYTQVKNIAVGF